MITQQYRNIPEVLCNIPGFPAHCYFKKKATLRLFSRYTLITIVNLKEMKFGFFSTDISDQGLMDDGKC